MSNTFHLRGAILPGGDVRDVFVRDGRFTFAAQDDAETIFDGGYLIPGLADAHAHLALFSPAGGDASPEDRARASARAQLDVGVLAIREPGSPDNGALSLLSDESLPRIVSAGHFLAPVGRYFPGLAREVDGNSLPDAAVEELAASGSWVKVVGDFFDPNGFTCNWTTDTLVETSKRVHAAGGRIAIHAVIDETIDQAIEAHFDSIEHATMLRSDQIAAMVRDGIALVPTMIIADGVRQSVRAAGIPDEQIRMIEAALDRQGDRVAEAVDAGVTVCAGTDAGMGPHGMIGTEIELFRRAGVSSETALGAGSWIARSYLGWPGIEEGAPADVAAFRDDPREALARPDVVLLRGLRPATR